MTKQIDNLKEWAINFIRNKDLIHRKLIEIKDDKSPNSFIAVFKDKIQYCYICLDLTTELVERHNNDENYGIFAFNTKQNFDFIMEKWNNLCQHKKLTLYLINPYSSSEEKWIIHPYTHSLIADKVSFKKGMNAMFKSVEPLLEKDLKKGSSS